MGGPHGPAQPARPARADSPATPAAAPTSGVPTPVPAAVPAAVPPPSTRRTYAPTPYAPTPYAPTPYAPQYAVPQYAAPGYLPTAAPAGPGSALAVTALVLAIVSAALCWIPFLGAVAAVAALVLGIVAWARAQAGRSGGKGLAIAATVIGACSVVLGIVLTVLVSRVIGDLVDCADPSLTQQQQQQCFNNVIGNSPSSQP